MKTGQGIDDMNIPYITIVGLDSILKRVSLKDMILYTTHNNLLISSELFRDSVCFNLFSEWGVGKKLQPIITDAFQNWEILCDKYTENPFYKEAARLSPEIVSQIRSEKSLFEWSYVYTTNSLFVQDEISLERFHRLFPLIADNLIVYSDEQHLDDDFSDEQCLEDDFSDEQRLDDDFSNEQSLDKDDCSCNFCNEFSKFVYPKTQNVEEIILDVIQGLVK